MVWEAIIQFSVVKEKLLTGHLQREHMFIWKLKTGQCGKRKLFMVPYIHHISCAYGNFAPVLYEATRYIDGLIFDPAESYT